MVPVKIYYHKEIEDNPISPVYWLMYCKFKIMLLNNFEKNLLRLTEERQLDKEEREYLNRKLQILKKI